MSSDSAFTNLTHHFLIAMPGLSDELFGKSVVYMCEHTERGALGLIINKPGDIQLADLFRKVDLQLRRDDLATAPVYQGGPLQPERGFVLHEPMVTLTPASEEGPGEPGSAAAVEADGAGGPGGGMAGHGSVYASTMRIPGGLEMTTSKDVLEAMSSGAGPRKVLVSLGYASWGEGQLESEITENSWLTVPADPAVIFDTPVELRYERAMGLLGLQPWMLSPDAGHA